MLFNSHIFIFVFLPVTLLVFFLLGRKNTFQAMVWLVIASLFYYAWWRYEYVFIILTSIAFNYLLAELITKRKGNSSGKRLLVTGIVVNVAVLAYYKYSGFFVEITNSVLDASYSISPIMLPLAISFFTFQQIAYLVDAYRGETEEHSFVQYCLFVTFFPQLIAGPIVHHREMLGQFTNKKRFFLSYENVAVGITIFSIGLFKKLMIADEMALYVSPTFDAVNNGAVIDFYQAWLASLAYTFQIYFDFSGYSDMAIGLARLFGIRLPLNFDSPYKSKNIIEFWRKWHMTLSRFLRDYLYIPMGGNRHGKNKSIRNLFLTMLIGGLWHGAGWTFIIWGALHGCYLVINHSWQQFLVRRSLGKCIHASLINFACIGLTFLSVVVAWVIFRSENIDTAIHMLSAMAGLNGFSFSDAYSSGFLLIGLLMLLVLYFPNTQQIMSNYKPSLDDVCIESKSWYSGICWKPTAITCILTSIILFISVIHLQRTSEFIYFQF